MHHKPKKTIDALGLSCPEPLMLLHAALNDLVGGESVKLIGDDSASLRDVKKLCHFLKHRVVFEQRESEQYNLIIEKKPDPEEL